mmetsp:Transcript_36665/g.71095  ORF Transcript_36665/g.71095 Transcript_36665/m.71095 type:complete len:163 (+) Transcript_36665:74-562(+)
MALRVIVPANKSSPQHSGDGAIIKGRKVRKAKQSPRQKIIDQKQRSCASPPWEIQRKVGRFTIMDRKKSRRSPGHESKEIKSTSTAVFSPALQVSTPPSVRFPRRRLWVISEKRTSTMLATRGSSCESLQMGLDSGRDAKKNEKEKETVRVVGRFKIVSVAR